MGTDGEYWEAQLIHRLSLTLHPTGALNTSEHVLSSACWGPGYQSDALAPPQAERITEGIPLVALGCSKDLFPQRRIWGHSRGWELGLPKQEMGGVVKSRWAWVL